MSAKNILYPGGKIAIPATKKSELQSRREELWVWDIETGPLPEAELLEAMPESIKNPIMPMELSQPEVPVWGELANGTIKDPQKLADWREKKRAEWHAAHQFKIAKWNDDCMKARFKFIDDAALSPETGRVLAIGMKLLGGNSIIIDETDEESLLDLFWSRVTDIRNRSESSRLIGFNTHKFDWRFVMARSWRYRIRTPRIMAGAYVDKALSIDLMEDWQCGNRQEYISLQRLSALLHVERPKECGSKAALFYKLWAEDREAALAYLHGDLGATEDCAIAMGYRP